MIRNTQRLIPLLAVAALILPVAALACDCAAQTDSEAFAQSPYVFTATAEKKIAHLGEKYVETTILSVDRVYKGETGGDLLPLYNNATDCAFHFEPGKHYLVFGDIEGSIHLKASTCTPTREVDADFVLDDPQHAPLTSP